MSTSHWPTNGDDRKDTDYQPEMESSHRREVPPRRRTKRASSPSPPMRKRMCLTRVRSRPVTNREGMPGIAMMMMITMGVMRMRRETTIDISVVVKRTEWKSRPFGRVIGFNQYM
jgi:hypothetical protein